MSIVGSSLVFIDGTVVSIALPVIQRDFHATATDAQWVIESYTLVLGALMLLSGALADRYGRKRIFLIGVVVFAIGSLACAFATSMQALIVARVLQGAGGTMLAPASLAMLGACFSGEARGKAIGTWSAFTAITATIGPVAGGALLDHAGWRWVFGINLPLAIVVVIFGLIHVRESRDETLKAAPDVLGSIGVSAGLGAVVYAFIAASLLGWRDLRVLVAMPAGVALLGLFWWWEARAAAPIVPRALFASRAFTGINLMTLFLYGALGGLFYFLPFVMIQVDGYSATIAGAAMLPFIVLLVTLSRFAGGLVYRIGARTTLTIGPAIAALGFAVFGLLGDLHYWPTIFPGTVLVGLGMGLAVAPLTTTVMESVKQHQVGLASGFNNAVSRVASLLAVAVLGLLLTAVFGARLSQRLADPSIGAAVRVRVERQRSAMAAAVVNDPAGRAALFVAYEDGFRAVAIACALLAAASATTAWLSLADRAHGEV